MRRTSFAWASFRVGRGAREHVALHLVRARQIAVVDIVGGIGDQAERRTADLPHQRLRLRRRIHDIADRRLQQQHGAAFDGVTRELMRGGAGLIERRRRLVVGMGRPVVMRMQAARLRGDVRRAEIEGALQHRLHAVEIGAPPRGIAGDPD